MAIPDWYRLSSPCPSNATLGADGWLHSPTTSICHFVLAVVTFVCTIVVLVSCSSISALWKRSYPLAITNLHWILFFLLSAIQSALHCAVYIQDPSSDHILHINFIAGTILRSSQIFLVALAFQHERIYRRIAIARINKSFQQSGCFERCHTVNFISAFLLLAQIVLVVLIEVKFPKVPLVWASQGVLVAQRLVVLCLVFLILRRHGDEDSPTICAQITAVSAMVLSSPADVTVHTLNSYGVDQCLIYFGTLYDLFVILHVCGLVLLLVYIRKEYVRLLPVCRYSLISSIQGQFDFHAH
ncbi:uncharacterized protein LOC135806491 [Sycon ciliatum]|uniref:uncharacterized protein LOC135806491 n=1 Tax=Sycon ciliatum TaxID=27933 RepID=UPI0020AEEA0C|eukprot:scpid73402/ scgid15882/ 